MTNPYRHPISTPVPQLQGIASIASPNHQPKETPNAVREAGARETLAKQYDASMPSRAAHIRAGTSDHKAIDAMLSFAALDSRAGDAGHELDDIAVIDFAGQFFDPFDTSPGATIRKWIRAVRGAFQASRKSVDHSKS